MANIIAKYKTKLSNDNIKQLLLIASDINQMAQLIGQDNINKLDDSNVNNICRTIWRDLTKSIAKVAATWLKLGIFWIKHQDQTSRKIGILFFRSCG